MTKRRPRGLKPEERELWQRYADGMRPRLPERDAPSRPAEPLEPKTDTRPPAPPAPPVQPFRIGEAARGGKGSVAVTPALKPFDRPARMDARTFGKLKKGRVSPDARIDLHGMTVEEAHTALIAFVLSRQARGDRLVLVITGKGSDGGPAPVERGVLRRQVPHWLGLPPLSGAVLDMAPAHRRHGGDGAIYVYLRRLR